MTTEEIKNRVEVIAQRTQQVIAIRNVALTTAPSAPAADTIVHTIHPYRHPRYMDTWVFDDPTVGLHQEPFVGGASEALDRLVAEVFGEADRITVDFSEAPINGAQRILIRSGLGLHPDHFGCSYNDGTEHLWLCPALTKYLDSPTAPEVIYLRARTAEEVPALP